MYNGACAFSTKPTALGRAAYSKTKIADNLLWYIWKKKRIKAVMHITEFSRSFCIMLARTTLTWTKLFWLKWSNKSESCHNWTIKRFFWLTPCWHNSRHESIKHSLSGVFCWFVISSKNHRPSDGINWCHESWMVYHILKIETLFSSQRWIDFLLAWRYAVLFSTVSGLTLSCTNYVQFQSSSSQFDFDNFSWFWLSVIYFSTLALLFARVLNTGYSKNGYHILFYKRFCRRKINGRSKPTKGWI